MPDLRVVDADANRAATADLLREHPLEPATMRAISGFKLRAALRRHPATAWMLHVARRVVGGGVR